MKRARLMLCGVAAAVLSIQWLHASAQEIYPSSPVRLVLAVGPGSTVDFVGRLLAQKLSEQLNANVVAENKPGANGDIAAEFVVRSKADGYTLMFNTASMILSRAFTDSQKMRYDMFKDLVPVGLVATAPMLIAVNTSVPANNVAEFIAYLRANPNKLAYGSSGNGNTTHLAPLLFLESNGLTALHVPYKEGTQAQIDLIAGRVQFRFTDYVSVTPAVKDKRIKVLAMTSLKRSPLLPDVPTLAESGMPGFEVGTWQGVMVPVNTPPEIIRRLNSAIIKALQDPDMKSRLVQQNVEALGSTPEEYGAYLRGEFERWNKVIKSAGVKLE